MKQMKAITFQLNYRYNNIEHDTNIIIDINKRGLYCRSETVLLRCSIRVVG